MRHHRKACTRPTRAVLHVGLLAAFVLVLPAIVQPARAACNFTALADSACPSTCSSCFSELKTVTVWESNITGHCTGSCGAEVTQAAQAEAAASGCPSSVSCGFFSSTTCGVAGESAHVDHQCSCSRTAVSSTCSACHDGYYLSAGACLPCPLGHYCTGSAQFDCPAGVFGNTTNLTSPACSGPCPSGRYGATPALTSSACSGLCGAGAYCPEGSTTSKPAACDAGYYATGNGLSHNSTCEGTCTAGYFCPTASTSPTAHACGHVTLYCATGSASPTSVSTGYYTTPTSAAVNVRTGQSECETGRCSCCL